MITIFTTKVNKILKNITIDKFFIYTKTNIKISAITIFTAKLKILQHVSKTSCQFFSWWKQGPGQAMLNL